MTDGILRSSVCCVNASFITSYVAPVRVRSDRYESVTPVPLPSVRPGTGRLYGVGGWNSPFYLFVV